MLRGAQKSVGILEENQGLSAWYKSKVAVRTGRQLHLKRKPHRTEGLVVLRLISVRRRNLDLHSRIHGWEVAWLG